MPAALRSRAPKGYNALVLAIFDNLGFSELMIVLIVAILIFGKRLPEVASQAGSQLAKFRRSLQDIKNETGIDNDLRNIQRDIQNAVPRNMSMGEMARIASIELEKRMKANDEPSAARSASKVIDTVAVETKPASASGAGASAALPSATSAMPSTPSASSMPSASSTPSATNTAPSSTSAEAAAHGATQNVIAPSAKPGEPAADTGAHP